MPKSFFRRLSKKIFIGANILTAVLFLIGCYNKFFFPLWWPVGLLSLAAFYLLVFLVLFIVFWLFAKPVWSLISIVAVAFAFKPVTNIIPYRFSSPPFALSGNAHDLRVMSWNVAQFDILFNKQRPDIRDEMLSLVNQYKPDIACFQEMVAGDTLVNLNTPYYRKYSFFSVFEYASRLHFPEYFYSYNFRNDFLNHQHFGLMIYSRYPIINKQTLSFEPHDYNSNFQYADIVKDKDTIRIVNFHLQSLKFTQGNLAYIDNPTLESKEDIQRSKSLIHKLKTGFQKRQLQSDRIKAEINKSPYPVIVCGDFNDVPNSYAYETIGDGLQNAFVKKGAGLGRTFSGISPTLRIDNIFMSNVFSVNQYARVEKKLSDHFPVIADIGR